MGRGILAIVASIVAACGFVRAQTITVAAAISLNPALTEIAKSYEADTGQRVQLTFGSSGELLGQIKSGAPIDVFISAAQKQVNELIDAGLADASTRRVVAGNRLVLIVPSDSPGNVTGFGSLVDPRVKRIAIGQPRLVPAGQYAQQVLRKLDLMDRLEDKLVYGLSVRQVLSYVEQGEASAGIVYATDAAGSGDRVRVVANADPANHDAIEYPAVVIKHESRDVPARSFINYLVTERPQSILKAHGFAVGHREPSTNRVSR